MSVVPVIAALSFRARRHVVAALDRAGAHSPETATVYAAQRRLERRWLERLVQDGSIGQVGADRFYVNAPVYAASMGRRRGRLLMTVGAIGLLALLATLLGQALR